MDFVPCVRKAKVSTGQYKFRTLEEFTEVVTVAWCSVSSNSSKHMVVVIFCPVRRYKKCLPRLGLTLLAVSPHRCYISASLLKQCHQYFAAMATAMLNFPSIYPYYKLFLFVSGHLEFTI